MIETILTQKRKGEGQMWEMLVPRLEAEGLVKPWKEDAPDA